MSTARTIGQITARRALRDCNLEELAAYQLGRNGGRNDGGIAFARNTDGEAKTRARQMILDLVSIEAWPTPLRILSMPGIDWRFERKLLGNREPGWMSGRLHPKLTRLTCIENDRLVYYGATVSIPGLESKNGGLRMQNKPDWAERTVKTNFIHRFHFANVDELMEDSNNGGLQGRHIFDVVWLDYTGPMTIERMKIIEKFYARSVRKILIVTALKARWNKATGNAIERAGGHSMWMRKHLLGEVLHDIEYMDTSPMIQFAIQHETQGPVNRGTA